MKHRIVLLLASFALSAVALFGSPKPKLVVVIVLDQFPYDYLARFEPYFGENGFRYLMRSGANFTNARYEYATTKTAAGHAAISTGTYAHGNGIVANYWWSRDRMKMVNSVDDDSAQILGRTSPGHSPKNLQTMTAGDMLRVSSNFHSKVLSFSQKDRSAVLLGGKFGTAYWIEDSLVVTSTYYMKSLPGWLAAYNASGDMRSFYGKEWSVLRPDVAAKICNDPVVPYISEIKGIGPAFPYVLLGTDPPHVTSSYFRALEFTPFGTQALLDVAREACRAESLGQRGVTDMLNIGVSTTDNIGHNFGPQSREVFDNALRTDAMLADFFAFLDRHVGLRNCVIALSSDHGIAPIPEYLTSRNPQFPAGRVAPSAIGATVSAFLTGLYGAPAEGQKWVDGVAEADVYLNRATLAAKHLSPAQTAALVKDSLGNKPPFAAAFTREELSSGTLTDPFAQLFARSFYGPSSGDVVFALRPYYIISGDRTGTNHGQPYEYDQHVPLVIAGPGVTAGEFRREVSPVDIAPTLCSILGIEFPPNRDGRVLLEALR